MTQQSHWVTEPFESTEINWSEQFSFQMQAGELPDSIGWGDTLRIIEKSREPALLLRTALNQILR